MWHVCHTESGNHRAGYVGSYGSNKANYVPNPYNAGYGMNQVRLLVSCGTTIDLLHFLILI
jgi:hypothetical protein